MSKRIGILTYHYSINDGAVLQAYALLRALSKYFYNSSVEVVDYRPLNSELKNIKESVISKKINTIPSKIKRCSIFYSFVKDKFKLSGKRIISNGQQQVQKYLDENYDAVFVGSDEIWKIEHGYLSRPFPNIYWLPAKSKFKKIAFAASANKLSYKELTRKQKAWMRESLERFDLLGIRDNHTLELLEYIGVSTKSKVMMVPDPTFTLETVKGRGLFLAEHGVDLNRKRAAVLLTDNKINQSVCAYLKSQGYQVIALSFYSEYADINLYGKLTPEEWAMSFSHFDVCVTDRFHGIVFSLKNKVPIIVIDDICDYKGYESKNYFLMKEFGLLRYYRDTIASSFDMENFKRLFKCALTDPEFKDLGGKLTQKKESCLSFIRQTGRLIPNYAKDQYSNVRI